ncbi:acyl carrier protein [Fulvimonas yonginensis]|uniref:Acyl carrier protein n=1 Tax=Fulvimonas yonginensis TaxID=1495200 RepID=A0ABU8JDS6_9GAMM
MNQPLSDEAIREQVFAIITRQAHVEPGALRPDATLKDLGVGSLEAIELIFDIEEHFDIVFPDTQASFDSDTVQNLLNAVKAALEAKPGGAEAAA